MTDKDPVLALELFAPARVDLLELDSLIGWQLARDDLAPDVFVSTIYLGIDHNFMGRGPPLLWETMAFGGPYDLGQWRYSTPEQALDGHREVVEKVKRALATVEDDHE